LLAGTPDRFAWFSFSCRDGAHISDGTPIVDCVRALESVPRISAIGINCTAPSHVSALIGAVRGVTDRPVVVYPNSGETWDAARKVWTGAADPVAFATAGVEWRRAGAQLIGGCCRTRPEDIRRLHDTLCAPA
jgi:homocysteine S-methyltransferase